MSNQPLTPAPRTDQSSYQPLVLNRARYRTYLAGPGLPEAEQDNMLDAVWAIIVGIIDSQNGFGLRVDGMALADDSIGVVSFASTSHTDNNEDALPLG